MLDKSNSGIDFVPQTMKKLRYGANTDAGRRALQPLADGYFAVCNSVLGDLDYMCKVLLLPRSTTEKGPCPLCRCRGKGPYTWCDFRPEALWRTVQWTTAERRAWPERSKSPLWDMENFSPWVIALDWMHMKYLGHDQLVYGSIFSLLTKFAMGGGSPLANLQILWRDIQSYYNSHQVPCRFRYLNKMSMFQRKEGQYPKLRGKAAEIKWLFGPMLYLWEKYHKPALQVHRQILLYLKLNYQVEEALVIHREALALPPEAASNFENSVTTMMLLLTSIAEHFLADRLFNITQKAHFIQHISILARFVSPRMTWCFVGEDMQKRMSTLAKTCVAGQQPGQTVVKMLARYRIGLHLQFAEHEKE